MSYTQKIFLKRSADHRDVRVGLKTPHEECEPLVLTSLFLPSHSLGGVLQGACPCTDINQCAGKEWKCINIPLAIARWINIFLLHSHRYLLDKTNRGQANGFLVMQWHAPPLPILTTAEPPSSLAFCQTCMHENKCMLIVC